MTRMIEQQDTLIAMYSSMRQFCQTNETCSDVENSECKWMSCKCKPGLSYHHDTKTCLSDCGDKGFGDTYQIEYNTYLNGFSTKTFKRVSAEECIQLCTVNTDFVCRTAEYWKSEGTCYLSWETLRSNPEVHKAHKDYVLYTRDCKR
ncbi:uncharacterized protein LOC132725285 [Ruditapes philippinarum]|uniref:uncharacterized protein LOC132725285 n=1 Tax=Ruditapes philippinarum TaxID=129788 RepID=UPI00295B4DB1|nr:uncharacterized protein LOC132725285 [Ruditapes philippinarum]